MIHTRRLACLVAVVLGMGGASAARAVPAPDPSSPLALIPADVAVVIQLHGVQRTTARIQALLKNAAPEDQKFLALALDGLIQQALDGRQIKGLDPDGPLFLVLLSVPRPGETPQFALVGRVTRYADFRDSFLREQEKKSIKADPAGYEVATLDNETAYFLDRKGFVIITPSREAADRFLKLRAGLDSKLDKEDAQALLAADLSAYADVAEIYKTYRDEIEQLRDGLQQAIQLAQGANNADQRTMELGWLVLRSLFQVMADGKSAVATVDFRPEGLALGLQLQVGAATTTGELLQEARPAPLKDLGLLPAGQLAYYAMQLDPGTAKVLVPLVQGTPALESDKQLRAALEEITAARPRSWVGTYHMPYEAAQVVDYEQPAKAMQAQIQLYQALAAGDQVQSLPLKNKPELRPQTLEHRGFKLQQVTFHWDFDSFANQPGGMEVVEIMKKLMGERTDIWFGTNGKAFVQIVARDWDSARKKLDQLFDNKNTVGQTRAFQEARRQLPDQASLISLLDLPQYVQMSAEVLQPILKAANAPVDFSGVKADKSKTSYLGTALTLQPERGRADLWLPAAGVAEVRRMLEPVLQKLLNP